MAGCHMLPRRATATPKVVQPWATTSSESESESESQRSAAYCMDSPSQDHYIVNASPANFDQISVLLANAFLDLWNHNWFQNLDSPVPQLPDYPVSPSSLRTPDGGDYKVAMFVRPDWNQWSVTQRRRIRFYRAVIEMVHLAGGCIRTVVLRDSERIVSALLWLPPHRRPSLIHILRSGFLRVAVWDYGLRALWRVQVTFEGNVQNLIHAQIGKMIKVGGEQQYAFVQMIGTHPDFRGHGYGTTLLRQQIEHHAKTFPESPGVILDTTTTPAIRLYERLGFRVIGETRVQTGTDASGINLSPDDPDLIRKRRESKETCIQRVMLLHTPTSS